MFGERKTACIYCVKILIHSSSSKCFIYPIVVIIWNINAANRQHLINIHTLPLFNKSTDNNAWFNSAVIFWHACNPFFSHCWNAVQKKKTIKHFRALLTQLASFSLSSLRMLHDTTKLFLEIFYPRVSNVWFPTTARPFTTFVTRCVSKIVLRHKPILLPVWFFNTSYWSSSKWSPICNVI